MNIFYLALFACHAIAATISTGQISQLSAEELEYLHGDPSITHKVTFDLVQEVSDTEVVALGSLHIGLFGSVVPRTVTNFVELSKGTYGFGYENSIFHRVINNFMIQGGDFQYGKGYGGHSIYNDRGPFEDENFELHHNKLGRLSMANSGANTNGAQFFITNVNEIGYLDGKHVVFGQLVGGFDVLEKVSTTETKDDRPVHTIRIKSISVSTIAEVTGTEYAPEIYDEGKSLSYFTYFSLLLLASVVAWYARNFYFSKQLIKDKKEASFYN